MKIQMKKWGFVLPVVVFIISVYLAKFIVMIYFEKGYEKENFIYKLLNYRNTLGIGLTSLAVIGLLLYSVITSINIVNSKFGKEIIATDDDYIYINMKYIPIKISWKKVNNIFFKNEGIDNTKGKSFLCIEYSYSDIWTKNIPIWLRKFFGDEHGCLYIWESWLFNESIYELYEKLYFEFLAQKK